MYEFHSTEKWDSIMVNHLANHTRHSPFYGSPFSFHILYPVSVSDLFIFFHPNYIVPLDKRPEPDQYFVSVLFCVLFLFAVGSTLSDAVFIIRNNNNNNNILSPFVNVALHIIPTNRKIRARKMYES